jgi:phage/conjugal plasmid C-4 type zinc finger TraR family protein
MPRFADELDLAQYQTDFLTSAAVAAIRERMLSNTGRKECLDCGEPIPSSRQRQVPGACRCVSCQEHHESRLISLRGH